MNRGIRQAAPLDPPDTRHEEVTMTAARERSLRSWRTLLAGIALLLVLASLLVGLGVAAAHLSTVPWAFLLVVTVLLAVLVAAVVVLGRFAARVPRASVLVLDLTEPLADHAPEDLRGRLRGRGRPGLRETLETLDRAAGDDRVAGLWCRIGRPCGGLADAQELREAVHVFRARGKFAVAFAETFGESGPGTTAYYVGAAFDEVVLQPSGDLNLTGFGAEATFLREALDRLRITPQIDRRREYKGAAERLTERGFTPANREATGRVVEAALEQVVEGVAADRGIEAAVVRALVDRAPLLPAEALDAGLVDKVGYRDEALDHARSRAGEGSRLLPLDQYRRRTRRRDGIQEPAVRADGGRRRGRRSRPKTVALVLGIGAVTSGRSRANPLTGWSMGSDSVCAAIRQAVADEHVRAILLRVDSPGGSYIASDAIWRETVRAREAGKPVVVSMGNVAGSGGYFVAMAADRILAQPGTLTGSIGVLSGKLVLAGLRARLGVATDEVHAGAHALMWSDKRAFGPSEWERFQAWLDRCYADFTQKAAEGRGLALSEIEEVARGRVWVGTDAAERGLVDVLGGYRQAFEEIRDVLGLAAGDPLKVVTFPKKVSPVARLLGRAPAPGEDLATPGRTVQGLLPSPAALASDLGLHGGDASLLMPEPWDLR